MAEQKRLTAILSRLGSEFDGERAAAGLLASRMLKQHGLTWDDLVLAPTAAREDPAPAPSCWSEDLALCLRHLSDLTPWEARFTRSLSRLARLSSKQRALLVEIADRLRAGGDR